MVRKSESGSNLWRVLAAPTLWAVHFLVCYVVVAVFCAKAGRLADADPARIAVLVVTLVCLLLIGLLARSTWRLWDYSVIGADLTYDANTPEERHRFLAHVTIMLCVLSAVGVMYVALPAVVLGTCR